MSDLQCEVRGDPAHLWSYAKYGAVMALVVSAVVLGFDDTLGGGRIRWFHPLLPVVTGLVFGGVFACVCWFWRGDVLPVAYVVTPTELLVLKGTEVTGRYPRGELADLRIHGSLDYRGCMTQFRYTPKWPHARLVINNSTGEKVVDLPDIMIWGRDPARDAERRLRVALGIGRGQGL